MERGVMKKFIIPVSIAFVAILLIKYITPSPLDWNPSYSRHDKIPLGTKIFFDVLGDMFPQQTTIHSASKSPYESFSEYPNFDAYLVVTNDFEIDETSLKTVLSRVQNGGTLFVSSQYFNESFLDTLGLQTGYFYGFSDEKNLAPLELYVPKSKPAVYQGQRRFVGKYFSKIDTATTTILGTTKGARPNFVRVQWKSGTIYVHSIPALFSNYALLDSNTQGYAARAISVLPSTHHILWDEYYKLDTQKNRNSKLGVILKDSRLTIAYYLLGVGVLLYVIFNGKRRQRIIPILKPYTNQTVEFVTTVGKLYFQHRDSTNLVDKQILYFNEYIRKQFYLREVKFNTELFQKISQKTNIPLNEVQSVFNSITTIKNRIVNDDNDVKKLSELIENFKRRCAG